MPMQLEPQITTIYKPFNNLKRMRKKLLLLCTALMGTLAASAKKDLVDINRLEVQDGEQREITNDDDWTRDGIVTVGWWEQLWNSTVTIGSDVTVKYVGTDNFMFADDAVIDLHGKLTGTLYRAMWNQGAKIKMYLDEGAEYTLTQNDEDFEDSYFEDGYDNHFQYIFSLPAEGGWRSLYLPTQAKVPAGCTAYWASSASGSTVTLKAINAGEVIPAHEGVILYGAGDKTMDGCYTQKPVTITGNLFQGVSTVTACSANENYVLNTSTSTAEKPMFSNYTGTSLGANKAYLPKSAVGGASSIQFRFDDATAISTVEMESSDDVLYNMAGQRVSSDYRGIVIKNGKKMFNL